MFYETPKDPASDTPLRIRGALHLASKYLMTDLRAKLVRIVEREWPLTVHDLENRTQLFHDFLCRVREDECEPDEWPAFSMPEPAAAVQLAEDFGIQSIMPAAYYELCRCSSNPAPEDWNGIKVKGSLDKPARWSCLSSPSLLKMIRVRNFIEEKLVEEFELFKNTTNMDCTTLKAGKCRAILDRMVDEEGEILPHVQDRDIIMQIRALRLRISDNSLCERCVKTFGSMARDAGEGFWWRLEKICCTNGDLN